VQGPSRLLLTRVLRDGEVWDVYVATIAQNGRPNRTELQFETRGADRKLRRCARPIEGELLAALHSGEPVSRSSLEGELDLAIQAPDDA
jgi:hypothetical protein